MELLFWLITAHFIGDFALQNQFMAENKSKLWLVMAAHCFIWTGVMLIPVKLYGFPITWQVVAFLFGIHFFIDKLKMWIFDKVNGNDVKITLFYIDQFCHLLQIAVLFAIYTI